MGNIIMNMATITNILIMIMVILAIINIIYSIISQKITNKAQRELYKKIENEWREREI